MPKFNPIKDKSFTFAVKIIPIYKLIKEAGYFDIASQVLKSSTSIGANINEALGANSKRDFLAKMVIAKKEAFETQYWLELVQSSYILDESIVINLIIDINEIVRILVSICKTTSLE